MVHSIVPSDVIWMHPRRQYSPRVCSLDLQSVSMTLRPIGLARGHGSGGVAPAGRRNKTISLQVIRVIEKGTLTSRA